MPARSKGRSQFVFQGRAFIWWIQSSEVDDRGGKFTGYRTIGSLQDYVLISSSRQQAETFDKQPEGIWAIGATVTKLQDSVRFRSLEIELTLAEIHAGVELPPEAPKSRSPGS